MADGLDAKVVRTSPVLWILGAVFAGFLGSLGTKLLIDVAAVFREPDSSQFRNAELKNLEAKRVALADSADPRRNKLQRAERDLAALDRAVSTGESSFKTWLDARATLGAEGDEDREVRSRRDRLDRLRQERDNAATAVDQM